METEGSVNLTHLKSTKISKTYLKILIYIHELDKLLQDNYFLKRSMYYRRINLKCKYKQIEKLYSVLGVPFSLCGVNLKGKRILVQLLNSANKLRFWRKIVFLRVKILFYVILSLKHERLYEKRKYCYVLKKII